MEPDDLPVDAEKTVEPMPDGHVPIELERARYVTRLLDDAVRIPVIDVRVGLDPILGIFPVGGDFLATLLSLYIVRQGKKLDVPRRTLGLMLVLVVIDFVIGSIPFVGPVFDTFWRANRWSFSMIESHVEAGDF